MFSRVQISTSVSLSRHPNWYSSGHAFIETISRLGYFCVMSSSQFLFPSFTAVMVSRSGRGFEQYRILVQKNMGLCNEYRIFFTHHYPYPNENTLLLDTGLYCGSDITISISVPRNTATIWLPFPFLMQCTIPEELRRFGSSFGVVRLDLDEYS